MESRGNSIFVLGSILLLFFAQHVTATTSKPVIVQAPENGVSHKVGKSGNHEKKKFEYKLGHAKGPEKQGEMNIKEWRVCKTGKLQSPIALSSQTAKEIPQPQDLKLAYRPANGVITNRGHDIAVVWDRGESGRITINGTRFTLKQCHWHSPSQHTIDGKSHMDLRVETIGISSSSEEEDPQKPPFVVISSYEDEFDLELHMVHTRKEENSTATYKAVVAVLYTIGAPDPFLATLLDDLPEIPRKDKRIPVDKVDPNQINGGRFPYYRYIGSLTTPPCTEGVIWTVSKKVRTASKEQIKKLREAVKDHTVSRPMQNLNNREILFYGL